MRRHASAWTQTQIVVFGVIAVIALYLVAWTALATYSERKRQPEGQKIIVDVSAALVPSPPEPFAESEASVVPFVDFILTNIDRDQAARTGRCDKDVCHNQCDPVCFQYPRKLRECKKAPCAEGEPWLLYEAELEYPLFFVDMPKFSSDEYRQFFLKAAPIKTDYLKQHASCPSPGSKTPEPRCALLAPFDQTEKLIFSAIAYIRGNIAVIRNGLYSGVPDDSFEEQRKCAYSSNYRMVAPASPPTPSQHHYDKLLILMMSVTGGAYFQHFIDRGLSILVQAWSMIEKDKDIKLLVSPVFDRHPIVPQIYERLGLKERLVYRSRLPITASEMYFSCVSPHYHPYTYQKARDIMGIDTQYPVDKRRTIVYLSRKESTSRVVTNEADVLVEVNKLLVEMASSGHAAYKLEVYDHKKMSHVNQTIDYFNKQARALIGPHGGAFYNQIFCASKTLLVEFFPYAAKPSEEYGALRWPEAVWWPAQFMGHTYYHVPTVTPHSGDMSIDIPSILRILRKELW